MDGKYQLVLFCLAIAIVGNVIPPTESCNISCGEKILNIAVNIILSALLASLGKNCITAALAVKGGGKGSAVTRALNALTDVCGELHMPGHNFTGPGTNLKKKMKPDGTWRARHAPLNSVDLASFHHDVAYSKAEDSLDRMAADEAMLDELQDILEDDGKCNREKLEAKVAQMAISIKCIARSV